MKKQGFLAWPILIAIAALVVGIFIGTSLDSTTETIEAGETETSTEVKTQSCIEKHGLSDDTIIFRHGGPTHTFSANWADIVNQVDNVYWSEVEVDNSPGSTKLFTEKDEVYIDCFYSDSKFTKTSDGSRLSIGVPSFICAGTNDYFSGGEPSLSRLTDFSEKCSS